jgi:hypothetical protein
MRFQVVELTLLFKFPWKDLDRGRLIDIDRQVQRHIQRGKHTPYSFSMLVVTDESPAELVKRVRPGFEAVGVIEDFWAQIVGLDATGPTGDFDPFTFRVKKAWVEANDRNKPKHLQERRPRDTRVENGVQKLDRGATLEMGFRSRGERKPTSDPDRH